MEAVKTQNRLARVPMRWICVGLVVFGLLILSRVLPLNDWLKAFNELVGRMGPSGMAIFAGVYVLATVLFMPSSLLTVGAGFAFGIAWGTLVVSIGSTTGAALAFLIARYVARDRIVEMAEKNEKFKAIDQAIGRQGWKMVGLLRLSPAIPFNLSNYIYGLTAVRFWPYVLASWLGMLPVTLLYVYFGAFGKASIEAASSVGTVRLNMGCLALDCWPRLSSPLWLPVWSERRCMVRRARRLIANQSLYLPITARGNIVFKQLNRRV